MKSIIAIISIILILSSCKDKDENDSGHPASHIASLTFVLRNCDRVNIYDNGILFTTLSGNGLGTDVFAAYAPEIYSHPYQVTYRVEVEPADSTLTSYISASLDVDGTFADEESIEGFVRYVDLHHSGE